jgi:hypothetical protein
LPLILVGQRVLGRDHEQLIKCMAKNIQADLDLAKEDRSQMIEALQLLRNAQEAEAQEREYISGKLSVISQSISTIGDTVGLNHVVFYHAGAMGSLVMKFARPIAVGEDVKDLAEEVKNTFGLETLPVIVSWSKLNG